MGITTKEIARICGVSRGTVDRALNGKNRISPVTKERILSTAKQLGYRKDMLARGLVKGKTMYIGVVVFDIRNHYFSQLVNAIELQAQAKNYFVNITLHEKNRQKEYQLINSLVDHRVDGILICPVNKGQDFEKFLKSLSVPVVTIGNYISEEIPSVGIDEKQAAKDAVSLLTAKGYRRILFICPPLADRESENVYTHEQRAYGFLECAKQNREIEMDVVGTWNFLEVIDRMLAEKKARTAIFCSGDIYALQILQYLKDKGVEVPKEVGVMGFDDIDMLDFITPSLATISNEIQEVGGAAVDLLWKYMNGQECEAHILVPHRVIEGESI